MLGRLREQGMTILVSTPYMDEAVLCDRIAFMQEGRMLALDTPTGKTTAIRMLAGLLAPTSGKATVVGFDLYTGAEGVKRNIGYMSQRVSLYDDLTVRENIRFFAGIYGLTNQAIKEKSRQLLDSLKLEAVADARLASLPLGWKQKLAFSVAILHEPKIVFLDEPTGGVDPVTRRRFWDMIYEASERGLTIFVTTHYMERPNTATDSASWWMAVWPRLTDRRR